MHGQLRACVRRRRGVSLVKDSTHRIRGDEIPTQGKLLDLLLSVFDVVVVDLRSGVLHAQGTVCCVNVDGPVV